MLDDVSNRTMAALSFGVATATTGSLGWTRASEIYSWHRSELPEEPRIGDRVSYEMGADRRPGREARISSVSVRPLNGDEGQKEKPLREGGVGASALG